MTAQQKKAIVRFSGDSGDGMQFTGSLFTDTSAQYGNDLSTFPDYPAEIRAPQGTVAGVSSFQIQIGGTEIYTPGDKADVLVAMNPAALKADLKNLKGGGTIIADKDNFTRKNLRKAEYETNPLEDETLYEYQVISVPMTSLTHESTKDLSLDMQTMRRFKNMFALGVVFWIFTRPLDNTLEFIEKKFQNKPDILEANKRVLRAGYYYAESTEILDQPITIPPAELPTGKYKNINGNTGIAWGLLAAAEKAGRQLCYCSYPITPASEILHELSIRKDLGAVVYQAEDEIAAICAATGSAFAGNLGVTATSGPGLALQSEGSGLNVMAELPLVIVNVQRTGPSTGLPTKTEQTDLLQALYGRNGEAPLPVIAASSPDDCFYYAYEACRVAVEHSTPVVLLSDAYLANGTNPWKIPEMNELPDIKAYRPEEVNGQGWLPYKRHSKTLARAWVAAGEKGYEHRTGGLEKEVDTGEISYDPENHERMVYNRQEKVERIANYVPQQEVTGKTSGKILLTGWGSTYGVLKTVADNLIGNGYDISFTHFNYIHPLPSNTEEVLSAFDKILVCELNAGQFAHLLRTKYPNLNYEQINKIQGQPFMVSEVEKEVLEHIKS